MLRSWSINVGRVFGVELRIHWTFFVMLGLVLMNEAVPGATLDPGRLLALAGIIFSSVLMHEVGHVAAARRVGAPIKASMLLPIGGIHVLEEDYGAASDAPRPGGMAGCQRELRISLAGPLANLVVAGATAAAMFALGLLPDALQAPLVHSNHLLRSLLWVNVGLAVFNLLPAYPSDGGRLLRAWFARTTDYPRATRRAVTIGHAIAMTAMLAGIVGQDVWLAIFGFSVFIGAQLEERSVLFHSVLESVRLEEIMLTDFATLSPADTLEDALERAVHSLQDDFPVIRGSAMVGVVTKNSILAALREDGNGYVQSVMEKLYEVSDRRETLASAFRKLTTRKLTIIPVLEKHGENDDELRLVGIVTLQNLMHSMGLLAESRKLKAEAE